MDTATLCEMLRPLWKDRRGAIKQQNMLNNSTENYLGKLLITNTALAKTGKQLRKAAHKLRLELEKDKPKPDDKGLAWRVFAIRVAQSARQARLPWDELRHLREFGMARLTRQHPVMSWVATVPGVSALGVGIIIGMTGDLNNYPTVAKMWTRCCVGMRDGRRQGNPGRLATAEDWTRHQYDKQRRSDIWAICGLGLFFKQWRAQKTDDNGNVIPAHPLGRYGEYYRRKKDEYLDRGWALKHADAAAKRYMSKCFLRDLWVAWRGAAPEIIL